MATDSEKVLVGVTGGVYHGDTDATLPTNATTAIDASLVEVGYVSEGGLTQSIAADTQSIKAWQNGDTVRTVQTSHELTYQFKMIESNDESQSIFYGATVTGGEIEITGNQMPLKSFVFEMFDGDQAIRIVCPSARVTERGDVVWKGDEEIGYEVTINCLPDTSGVKAYIYQDAVS